jgi:hypothetical protein
MVAPAGEDAFLAKALHSFPDGAPGGVQLDGEDGFVDLFSRTEDALDDLFPQLIGYQFRGGPSFQGAAQADDCEFSVHG